MPGCPFVERGLINLVIFCLSRKSMYFMSVEYYVKGRPIGWLRFCTLCKSHTRATLSAIFLFNLNCLPVVSLW